MLIIVEIITHIFENAMKHGFRQHACIGVVARAVIAGKNPQRPDIGLGGMAEFMFRNGLAKGTNSGLMRYCTECYNGLQIWEAGNKRRQELPAGINFGAGRFVFRRDTANSVDDGAIIERQRIIRTCFEIAPSEIIFF